MDLGEAIRLHEEMMVIDGLNASYFLNEEVSADH